MLSSLALATNAFASLSIENLNSPVVVDFTGFDGSGFSPNPSAGQLDSNQWAIDGLSDGPLDFGETGTSGDFAKGLKSGSVSAGGIYAFDIGDGNTALGVQPGGSDWTPGSFTLKMQNNTGQTITTLDVAYSIYLYNDQGRSSSFNFSYSVDGINYIQIDILNFESPEIADGSPVWMETLLDTTLVDLSIADGENFYFRWSGDDVSGSGVRDQFGLDNISITTAVPEPKYFGLICSFINTVRRKKKNSCSWNLTTGYQPP